MIKYLKRALSLFMIAFFAPILFFSCEKDNRTSAEWGELASAKRSEIRALGANILCSQKDRVTVQPLTHGCSTEYFTVHASDLSKYEKLKKEYLHFVDEQYASLHREGLIVEPCSETIWVAEQPIRIDCKGDKVHLITSENLELDEAGALADASYGEIMSLVNSQTCTGADSFAYTALINYKSMKVEYITLSENCGLQSPQRKSVAVQSFGIQDC